MKKLALKSILLCCCLASVATLSAQSAKSDIQDNNPVFPPTMEDIKTKEMMSNWYLSRYAVVDSLSKQATVTDVSDAEYINRLQSMNTVIEMPFNSVVKQYIEMYANKRPQLIQKMLGLSLYYMPIFEDALARLELPDELKYLPIIESALNPNAVSPAGAAGLWQFMPSTATGKGLEVNSLVDERRDPLRSSYAAASLLKELYDIYGDWALVLAAYNCGPGNVNKAIKSSGGKRDFWEIYNYLPRETRGYVPAFIAATYIMNHYGKHGITPVLAREPLVIDTVHVNNRVNFNQISQVLGVSIDELRTLNPQYRQDVIPGNVKPYALILPSIQAGCYRENEDSILNFNRAKYEPRLVVEPGQGTSKSQSDLAAESQAKASSANAVTGTDSIGAYTEEIVTKYHTVQRGETLKTISELYDVTVEDIRNDNDLEDNKVKRGQKLTINTRSRNYAQAQPAAATKPVAQVQTTAPAAYQTKPANTGYNNGYYNNGYYNNGYYNNNAYRGNTGYGRTNGYGYSRGTQAKPKTQTRTQPASTKHTVKAGESLEKIARQNGTTVDALRRANGIKGDKIMPGQQITVPKGKAATTTKKTTSGNKGKTTTTTKKSTGKKSSGKKK